MNRKFAAFAILLTLVATALPARASDVSQPPEALLAEESVLYFRFDGLGSHQDAYNQTIFAQLLRDEFGPLIDDLGRRILDAVGPQLLSERLLTGIKPDQLLKVQSANKQLPNLLEYFWQHGFVVGAEVIAPLGPRFQVTVVFPNGGSEKNRSAIFGGFRLLGLLSNTEVQEVQHGDRVLLQLKTPDPVKVLCWQESQHMVLTIGTEEIGYTQDMIRGNRPNLTANPVYKQVAGFKRYETFKRGFFDLDRVIQIAESAFPPAVLVFDKLGLKGLKNASFHIGFQQQHLRSTFILSMPGKRDGLLRLLSSAEGLELQNLPSLPPDAVTVGVSRFSLATAYDSIIEAIEVGIGTFQPKELGAFRQGLKSVESALGIDLHADLFDTLGSTMIAYNAPSEGPLNIGTALAIQVKDAEKLTKSIETLIKSLTATTGADIHVKKQLYRGTYLYTVHVAETGFPFVPSYAVHDGWLVVSLYPQTVQGFIFRASGKHAVWKPPAIAKRAIDDVTGGNANARITAVSVSDPRPTVRQILSVTPLLVKAITGFSGSGSDFDISVIPNSQTVTERLTHNVSIAVDDGKSVRFEGYSSLPLPLHITGLEYFLFLGSFSFLRLAF